MKKKNMAAYLIVVLAALLSVVGSSYAFYQIGTSKTMTASTNITDTDDIVIQVDTFSKLFLYSKDSIYNNSSKVSSVSSSSLKESSVRKVLKLTADVTMTTDLVITADVHIDLNGHTLNLNDHVLTVKHGFDGCFSLYNGTIETGTNGSGYIALDLVNASVKTDDVSYTSNGAAASSCIQVVNLDQKYTAYSALYMAANAVMSDIGDRVDFEDFSTVSADSFDITDQTNYILSKTCSYNSNEAERCSFAFRDIDLPFWYLSTDIKISYVSDQPEYISNGGKVIKLPDTEQDVNLTATVYCESWGSATYSTTFKIHLVNLDDAATKNKVANLLITNYLQPYYVGESLTVTTGKTLEGYYYAFNHTIQLPLTALDGNITYDYKTYDFAGTTEVVTESAKDGNVYNFMPNNSCFHLGVSVNGGSYNQLQMYSVYVGTLESAARMIMNSAYGGTIIYDKTLEQVGLKTLDDMKSTSEAAVYIDEYNVTGVSYAMKDNTSAAAFFTVTSANSGYSLVINQDEINNIKSKYGYVTATFTFEGGSSVAIDMYISCYDRSGNTNSGFLPYYSEFDKTVANELKTSFDLPFCYENAAPYVCYDFAYETKTTPGNANGESFNYYDNLQLGMPASVKISLYYDGAKQYTFTNYSSTSPASMTAQLDSFAASSGLTLTQIAQKTDVKYIVELDVQNATEDNVDMLLIYNYKFSEGNSWSRYEYEVTTTSGDTETKTIYMTELVVSDFEVKGGLFYDSSKSSTAANAVYDSNFFVWIYNHFNPNLETISSANSTTLILADWLGQDAVIDYTTDTTLSQVTDFTGIQNLKSVSTVNLSGMSVSDKLLEGIVQMTSVTDLNLSDCDLDDDSVETLSTMSAVKTLDISNNSIQYFDDLVNMTSLQTVYLYNNNETDSNYGSVGICNSQAYVDLMRNGVAVYNNVSNGIPISYSESDNMDDYKRLAAIIYQDKLSKNVSIENLYSTFENELDDASSDFDMDNTGGTFTWGYEDGKTVYTATYFYVKYAYSSYTLTVKYYVERY